MKKIACVVVTYNRKSLLKRCIDAIINQSYSPACIYIIDNASTDGTHSALMECGYANSEVNSIQIVYKQLESNQGGAGGFYNGFKIAHESNLYDAYWVMDDDGMPDKDCLKNLAQYLDKGHHYISPLTLDIDNSYQLAFPYKDSHNVNNLIENAKENIVHGYSCPFNGILYSKQLVSDVGYPMKELFIWGDEVNYKLRCLNNGYNAVCVINAIHYHPLNRTERNKALTTRVNYCPTLWRSYCHYRNHTYNEIYVRRQNLWVLHFISFLINNIFYLSIVKKDFSNLKILLLAVSDGIRKKWDGHKKYM